jgi:hypothetical protein
MEYRSSPYIEFNSGTVVTPPMELSGERIRPHSLDDMLDLFECRVDVWQLGPAVQVLKQIETHSEPSVWSHTAYALLAIVFTYFEMIGKTLNPASKSSGTANLDFNYGFCDVYPAFDLTNGDREDAALPDVREFRDRVRNGLYHLGYTKGNLFIHNEQSPDDFFIDRRGPKPVYLMNPHRVTRTIVAHFPSFMGRLRDPDQQFDDLRARFRRFFGEFHGLR